MQFIDPVSKRAKYFLIGCFVNLFKNKFYFIIFIFIFLGANTYMCKKIWFYISNPDFYISFVTDKLPSETRDMKKSYWFGNFKN